MRSFIQASKGEYFLILYIHTFIFICRSYIYTHTHLFSNANCLCLCFLLFVTLLCFASPCLSITFSPPPSCILCAHISCFFVSHFSIPSFFVLCSCSRFSSACRVLLTYSFPVPGVSFSILRLSLCTACRIHWLRWKGNCWVFFFLFLFLWSNVPFSPRGSFKM